MAPVINPRPLPSEPVFLAYLLTVIEDTRPAMDFPWQRSLWTRELLEAHALGRCREAIVHRLNRLEQASAEEFLLKELLRDCAGSTGVRPEQHLLPSTLVNFMRNRIWVRLREGRVA